MTSALVTQLEEKVIHAVEVIDLLKLQVEALEEENLALKAEQEKWRSDLAGLLKRFEPIETMDANTQAAPTYHAEPELVD